MPGMYMQDGTLYIDQLEVIKASNIKNGTISDIVTASRSENVSMSIYSWTTYLSAGLTMAKAGVAMLNVKMYRNVGDPQNVRILRNGVEIENIAIARSDPSLLSFFVMTDFSAGWNSIELQMQGGITLSALLRMIGIIR